MRALVLDDSKTARMILRRILQGSGFEEISEAADGRDGLQRLKEMGKPDLVTVDWAMPIMDGLAFVRQVRADHAYDALPLVMVTVNNKMAKVSTALEAGVTEYIMKPFTEEVLREKLELLGVLEA